MTDVITTILNEMRNSLTVAQLAKLESVLIDTLRTDCPPVTEDEKFKKTLDLYLATKRLEGCSEGTVSGYRLAISLMHEKLPKPLGDITTDDLRFYLTTYQVERKVSLSYLDTIRKYLSAFFTWLCDEGHITSNPMKRIPKIKSAEKIRLPFSAEDREALKDHASTERDIAIQEVLYSTAARVGEVVSLNRRDVDLSARSIKLYGSKGKQERIVYLTEEAAYHLKKYLASRTDDNPALFVTLDAPHERLKKSGIQAMLRHLGNECGIYAHPHKFRRTLLSDGSQRGMTLQELQRYAGHKSPETTMVYVTVKAEAVHSSYTKAFN